MTIQGLSYISKLLTDAKIPYSFVQWNKEVEYPYFVGEYLESEPLNEDGETNTDFILTGTTNASWLTLERYKQAVINMFTYEGITHIFDDGTAIAVMYADSQPVPTNTDDLKRIQINLKIKEWRVN